MSRTKETKDDIVIEALKILFREMGVAKTLRFYGQTGLGRGDYTLERQNADDKRSVDDIIAEIEKKRGVRIS